MLWAGLAIVVYLIIGIFFNTSGFSWYKRILLHILWLPAMLMVFFVLKNGKKKR